MLIRALLVENATPNKQSKPGAEAKRGNLRSSLIDDNQRGIAPLSSNLKIYIRTSSQKRLLEKSPQPPCNPNQTLNQKQLFLQKV
jgi:hypothetical protein